MEISKFTIPDDKFDFLFKSYSNNCKTHNARVYFILAYLYTRDISKYKYVLNEDNKLDPLPCGFVCLCDNCKPGRSVLMPIWLNADFDGDELNILITNPENFSIERPLSLGKKTLKRINNSLRGCQETRKKPLCPGKIHTVFLFF